MIKHVKALFILIILLLTLQTAQAGGWAVVTLTSLPGSVVAGEPLAINFAVRQHGQHLVAGLSTTITAAHTETGASFVVEAVPTDEDGYYEATLIFPESGTWDWSIDAFGYDRPMPPLAVQATALSVAEGQGVSWPVESNGVISLAVGFIGLVITSVALLAWFRRRSRMRLAAVFMAIVISAIGFLTYSDMPASVVALKDTATTTPAIAAADMGEALFVAKGCITCHQHNGVTMSPNLLPFGPALSNYQASPEFLALWLQNPPDIKPNTLMPVLGLNEDEIQSLIAFLNEDTAVK
jgi:mono/diheme cytochrome c family protein